MDNKKYDNGTKDLSRKEEEVNARRVNELINVVEKKTRTERHMENAGMYSSPEQHKHEKEIQNRRDEEINGIKSAMFNSEGTKEWERKNLEENYASTQGYIENNGDHMDPDQLCNLREKQCNRREQLNNLK